MGRCARLAITTPTAPNYCQQKELTWRHARVEYLGPVNSIRAQNVGFDGDDLRLRQALLVAVGRPLKSRIRSVRNGAFLEESVDLGREDGRVVVTQVGGHWIQCGHRATVGPRMGDSVDAFRTVTGTAVCGKERPALFPVADESGSISRRLTFAGFVFVLCRRLCLGRGLASPRTKTPQVIGQFRPLLRAERSVRRHDGLQVVRFRVSNLSRKPAGAAERFASLAGLGCGSC